MAIAQLGVSIGTGIVSTIFNLRPSGHHPLRILRLSAMLLTPVSAGPRTTVRQRGPARAFARARHGGYDTGILLKGALQCAFYHRRVWTFRRLGRAGPLDRIPAAICPDVAQPQPARRIRRGLRGTPRRFQRPLVAGSLGAGADRMLLISGSRSGTAPPARKRPSTPRRAGVGDQYTSYMAAVPETRRWYAELRPEEWLKTRRRITIMRDDIRIVLYARPPKC